MLVSIPSLLLTFIAIAIEDLCMLSNGILLSCAYDKLVIAWAYQKEEEITRYEKNEELRCMDYIENQGKLFVGTNKSNIITLDISPLLELNSWQDQSTAKKPNLHDTGYASKFDLHRAHDDQSRLEASPDQENRRHDSLGSDIDTANIKPSEDLKKLLEVQNQLVNK
jgi:hypothetical protein